MKHFPALDGIRGPFVIAVVSYHADMGFPGALTTMTGFFVLSGFLIASLLLREWQRDGHIDLTRFMLSRARRLLPAAMVTIAVVAVAWNLWPLMYVPPEADYDALGRLNENLVAATFYFYNWRRAFGPTWEGFSSYVHPYPPEASPIGHLWSLSVEEQFYLLFPLCCLLILTVFRNVWAVAVAAILAIIAAAFFVPSLGPVDSQEALSTVDRLYNGTDARLGEISMGVILAVIYATPKGTRFIEGSRWVAVAGVLATLVAGYWIFYSAITDWWLYRGGLLLVAAVYATVIAAGIQSQGVVPLLFSWAPFRWLGVRSYGAYLYHLPILRWIDDTVVDWPDWTLYLVRMAVTILVAAVSYEFLEIPIRRRCRPRFSWWWALAGMIPIIALFTAIMLGVWV